MADDFGRGFNSGVSLGQNIASDVTRAMRQDKADKIANELYGTKRGVAEAEMRTALERERRAQGQDTRSAMSSEIDRAAGINALVLGRQKAARLDTFEKAIPSFSFLLDNYERTMRNPEVSPQARQGAKLKYAELMGRASLYGDDTDRAAKSIAQAIKGDEQSVNTETWKQGENGAFVGERSTEKRFPLLKPVGLGNDGSQVDPEIRGDAPVSSTVPILDPSDRATYDALQSGAQYQIKGRSAIYRKP